MAIHGIIHFVKLHERLAFIIKVLIARKKRGLIYSQRVDPCICNQSFKVSL